MKSSLQVDNEEPRRPLENITAPLVNCIKTFVDEGEGISMEKASVSDLADLESLLDDNGFIIAVSLHDTNVVYVSSGVSKSLGYPQDMLVGQSLLGYLYPRDRLTFANFMSQGIQARFSPNHLDDKDKLIFYARIREYRGLKYGFGVAGKKSKCMPFQLKCSLKEVIMSREETEIQKNVLCFIINAIPLIPAHKLSDERNPAMVPFSTRHTPTCHFSHIDPASIPFLGYFPQDIIGFSIFDFYHQDDLFLIREVYDKITTGEGSICSRPYRFKIFNGDYIILETEWSCFINPWSRKFEFVVGQHRIIQGPTNMDVFEETAKTHLKGDGTSLEGKDSPQAKKIQEEIFQLLSRPVKKLSKSPTRSSLKRKRKLAAYVSDIIDGKSMSTIKEFGEDPWSDKESVLMGEISPHCEDSEESTDTPPPFQQERLKDNIERFFASQPKTNCASSASGGSSSQNPSPPGSGSNDGSGKSSNAKQSSKDSAFQSASCEDKSCDQSNRQTNYSECLLTQSTESREVTRESEVYEGKFTPMLTEDILAKHDRLLERRSRDKKKGKTGKKSGEDIRLKDHRTKKQSKRQLPESVRRVNRVNNLDEVTFSIQPPFSFAFPLPLNASGCPSCSPTTNLPTHHQLMVPVMCALPFPFCQSSQENAKSAFAAHFGNLHGFSRKKNVRVQTELPVHTFAHTIPSSSKSQWGVRRTERDKLHVAKDEKVKRKIESRKSSQDNLDVGERSSESFSSSSFLKSEETFAGGFQDDELAEIPKTCLKLDHRSETSCSPWLKGIDFSEDIIYRYRIDVNEKEALPETVTIEQPALVKKQFTLLKSEVGPSSSSFPVNLTPVAELDDPIQKDVLDMIEDDVM